jgi:hypothetical protein
MYKSLIFFVLVSAQFLITANSSAQVFPLGAEIRICRIERILWTKHNHANIYFGQNSAGGGMILKSGIPSSDSSLSAVDRRFRIDEFQQILWWNEATKKYDEQQPSLEVKQGTSVFLMGINSSCSIDWKQVENELHLVVKAHDSYARGTAEQSMKAPK